MIKIFGFVAGSFQFPCCLPSESLLAAATNQQADSNDLAGKQLSDSRRPLFRIRIQDRETLLKTAKNSFIIENISQSEVRLGNTAFHFRSFLSRNKNIFSTLDDY